MKKIKQLNGYYEELQNDKTIVFVCNKCLRDLSTYKENHDRIKSMNRARYLLSLEHLGNNCMA